MDEDEKGLGLVKNPICRRFFVIFRILGTVVMVCALVADYTYAFKQTFSSRELYLIYLGVLAQRCVIPILIMLKNMFQKVCGKENKSLGKTHFKLGILLYTVIPTTYFTGSYRLLNFKNFPSEIGIGLVFDFFLNALPLLFIQAINNTTLSQKSFDSGNIFEISTL